MASVLLEFTLSILLLLATPGPTNTLMALAGYQRSWRRAAPLIGAELCGYLLVIIPVATLAASLFEEWPQLALWTKLLAGLWVLYLAVKLWSFKSGAGEARAVDARSVLVTTCLNPKALIIGLVIMPHQGLAALLPWLSLFSALVLAAANGWIAFGTLLSKGMLKRASPAVISRAAAAGLFVFVMILAGASLKGLA
ncbi:LysE family translocator [Rhizobium oryzicola]|uniref:Threonine transporter RhtB n=1 Tax=Rhizobium oryzicola TaxID=1232668 RepID=A0ABT8SQ42_9HYPH|nr:threonine transporter RhtB [Rhizobium oryzicola]MDO1580584.1 threonine transporter RhtB [Rhizobium oryzicola]